MILQILISLHNIYNLTILILALQYRIKSLRLTSKKYFFSIQDESGGQFPTKLKHARKIAQNWCLKSWGKFFFPKMILEINNEMFCDMIKQFLSTLKLYGLSHISANSLNYIPPSNLKSSEIRGGLAPRIRKSPYNFFGFAEYKGGYKTRLYFHLNSLGSDFFQKLKNNFSNVRYGKNY